MIRAVVFALAALTAADAWACSRCGIFGRGCRFSSSHHVEHVQAVVAAPVIQPPSIAIVNNYPPANGAAGGSVAVLLIESGLWTRYAVTPLGMAAQPHVAGPLPGEAVIVTSEAVLRALVDGALALPQASAWGVLAISLAAGT